ncbi:type II secretion system F family protein [Levilactobacillus fujinensis]|uniref:Type II secretion system F family protein n=1 Tax=Levilactobacillus fujinensis TaxID=2486024 RepID=A0ABW1TDB8_9LACO
MQERLQQQRNKIFGRGRWTLTQQAQFCRLLADQLQSGFSLKQAVHFICVVANGLPNEVANLELRLAAGADFVGLMAPYLQANVYFQLELMTKYGELAPALDQAATLLQLMATQRRRLHQLLVYPMGLLASMALVFVTLRVVILPQLQQEMGRDGILSRGWRDYLVVGGSLLIVGTSALGWRWWHRQSSLLRAKWILHWPVVGHLFRAYYAYYLTLNLSQMVHSGLSIKQMLRVLDQLPERALLHQLAAVLAQHLSVGDLPIVWLRNQSYIPPQVIILLQKGSTTPQLGRELTAYSRLQYRELVRRSEQGLAIVQPLLLGIVALLIVGAYLSLLLPMYQNLQGVA